MNPSVISPITKEIVVLFGQKSIELPQDIQEKIDAYWEDLVRSGKKYTRGEVLTVVKKSETEERVELLVEKTDYAHYLYCQDVDPLGEYGVHIIHTAALVETLDNAVIFGRMGAHTSRAGIYQMCGGGIDDNDLKGNMFDLQHNIQRELEEELGIDVTDTERVGSFREVYFKEGGPTDKMAIVYKVGLLESSSEFMGRYETFAHDLAERGGIPEFGEVVALERTREVLVQFLEKNMLQSDECLFTLFEYIKDKELVEMSEGFFR